MKQYSNLLLISLFLVFIVPAPAYAMHISEGILPLPWAGFWYLVSFPFVAIGVSRIRKNSKQIPAFLPLIGMISAALFIVSAMPIPIPVAGTCSHPAGTGIASILVGPFATVVSTSIALLIQALFLAHGGITTLGANTLSMGVVGSFSSYFVFRALTKTRLPLTLAAFAAALISDWATYATTSLELALGLGNKTSFLTLFKAIVIAFIPTQLPIGILEGFAAAGFFAFILKRRPDILVSLSIIPAEHKLKETSQDEQAVY